MRILGIETSCDETAAAVVEATEQRSNRATKQPVVPLFSCSVLSNVVASQIKIHAKTGGVVPEVAARAHVEKIIPVVEEALKRAHPLLNPPPLRGRKGGGIDAIAVTAGPGLATSLLVGVEVARTLSWLWKKPLIAVNHLAGHIYANWLPVRETRNLKLETRSKFPVSSPKASPPWEDNFQFPILALIVSGGHTELVLMRKHLDFKIIGSTRDDAAGEAFDKVAKMLGLGYPGGPAISREAEKWKSEIRNPKSEINSKSKISNSKTTSYILPPTPSIHFPRPMVDSPDFDFSFSGLKTAVLYWLRAKSKERRAKPYALSPELLAAVCYEFQQAVVDVLVSKTIRAAKKYRVKTVLLGGGVAANARLRQQLSAAIKRHVPSAVSCMPSAEYTTDNAAMIAAAGYFMARAKQFTPWQKLDVDPNWQLGSKFHPIPRG